MLSKYMYTILTDKIFILLLLDINIVDLYKMVNICQKINLNFFLFMFLLKIGQLFIRIIIVFN